MTFPVQKSHFFFASLSEQTVRAFQLPLAVTVENFKRRNSVKVVIKIYLSRKRVMPKVTFAVSEAH